MTDDREAARKSRAERLHKQIDILKNERKKPEPNRSTDTGRVTPETPAEFIHRRMHELDETKK